jgi:protein PhnA
MAIPKSLEERCGGMCELCAAEPATIEYTVSPKEEITENQVAICTTCEENLSNKDARDHWQCLSGSIWSQEPAVQALTYRVLYGMQEQAWARDIMEMVDLDENIMQWGSSFYDVAAVHQDAFGNVLENGDNVVLTQALKVKGTNFTASKGTVVKKIKLVSDNTGQIEGKINEQVIVILTQYVKKNN